MVNSVNINIDCSCDSCCPGLHSIIQRVRSRNDLQEEKPELKRESTEEKVERTFIQAVKNLVTRRREEIHHEEEMKVEEMI